MHFSLSTSALLFVSLCSTLISAYRPVQFVKHTGQSGRADQAFSLVNYYNETTQQSDLYVRMWMFRYKSSANGWASLAFGPRMIGSFMFIIYGDPSSTDDMGFTVRTVDGHHPPRPLDEFKEFYDGPRPDVELISSRFQPYTGEYYSEQYQLKPSHIGEAKFIVHGYEKWKKTELEITNSTTKQAMIWSSNFKQDFQGDFSFARHVDMHAFGLGFGFLWADFKNAVSPYPFFEDINDLNDHTGVNEIADPNPPTDEELKNGEAIIAKQASIFAAGGAVPDTGSSSETPADDKSVPDTESSNDTPADDKSVPDVESSDDTSTPDEAIPDTGSSNDTPAADDGTDVEEPVKSPKQWNIRSLMWHLHGGLMVLSFLVLYPLGVYLLRSPRPTAFNLHWTVNSLSSVCVSVAAMVGFVNSRSISITHQYVGILLVCGLAVQTVLGWRHHIIYLQVQRRTWMSNVHLWLGRVVLPLGMLNIISGLLLRQYGWLTISLTIAVAAIEMLMLVFIVRRARTHRPGGMQKGPSAPTADEAEEYFQLTGADDVDDLSDDDAAGSEGGAAKKDLERADQQKRLARLDKV